MMWNGLQNRKVYVSPPRKPIYDVLLGFLSATDSDAYIFVLSTPFLKTNRFLSLSLSDTHVCAFPSHKKMRGGIRPAKNGFFC